MDDPAGVGQRRRAPATSADEPALLVAARHGDRDALDQLLRLHQPRLHTLCRRLCHDPTDALDALQEALIAVVRGLPGFDGRSSFSTWTYRVATNACLDELRRRKRRPVASEAAHREALASASEHPERAAERVDIDRALATLTDEFRAAIVLRDLCGFDYAEIADVLGIPPGTVRSRIARGRGALAAALSPATDLPGNPTGDDQRPTAAS